MEFDFTKYHANGNDFIIFNNLGHRPVYIHSPTTTQQLCHRQFGIGADGVITIESKEGYDFELLHYNADGSPGQGLCGNGSRAALHYAQHIGLIKNKGHFFAIDGAHTGYIAEQKVYIKLRKVTKIEPLHLGYFIHNGTAHYVEFVNDVQQVNIQQDGLARRHMSPFEKTGVNINFVEIKGNAIALRTCECGLPYEPMSCGTGAVASALTSHIHHGLTSPIQVLTQGGKLWVSFTQRAESKEFIDVYLSGFVARTFSGVLAHDPKSMFP